MKMNEMIPLLSIVLVAVIILIIICAIALLLFLFYICFSWLLDIQPTRIHSHESYVI